jgi:hypothetical protein
MRGPFESLWFDRLKIDIPKKKVKREKFLFLDIDGVLCIKESLHARGSSALDPACVARLNRVVAITGCKIVISSAWRVVNDVESIADIFATQGFAFPASIIDATPTWQMMGKNVMGVYPERSDEIRKWCEDHGVEESQIACLDDEFLGPLEHRLAYVAQGFYNGGMQDSHVEKLVELLGE